MTRKKAVEAVEADPVELVEVTMLVRISYSAGARDACIADIKPHQNTSTGCADGKSYSIKAEKVIGVKSHHEKPRYNNHRACAVRERTADNVSVGRCYHFVGDVNICPRHGNVSDVQKRFSETGKLTDENDLLPRKTLKKP